MAGDERRTTWGGNGGKDLPLRGLAGIERLQRMSDAMRRRREHRREFLHRLYELVDGSVSEFVRASAVGELLGIDEVETRRIFEYLEEKQLVMVDDHRAGILRITATGVDEVEASA